MSSLDGDTCAAGLQVWLLCKHREALQHNAIVNALYCNSECDVITANHQRSKHGSLLQLGSDMRMSYCKWYALTRDSSGQGSFVKAACLQLCMVSI